MFSSAFTISDFLESVPVCQAKTDLETVLNLFQSANCDRLVVLAHNQAPVGLIRSVMVLKHLSDFSQPSPAVGAIAGLISPVMILSVQTEIGQVLSFLPKTEQDRGNFPDVATVDAQGKFCGLLNRESLLKFLLSCEFENWKQNRYGEIPQWEGFLYQLLEQIPLPIRLTTQQGQILYENLDWLTHLGDCVCASGSKFSPLLPQELISQYSRQSNGDDFCPSEKITGTGVSNNLYCQALQLGEFRGKKLADSQVYRETVNSWRTIPDLSLFSVNNALHSSCGRVWQLVKIPLSLPCVNFPHPPLSLIIALDKTEQEYLSQEIALKNADLLQSNKIKTDYFNYISHELKSPITSLIGLSSLLKDQKLGALNERQAHYAELIHRSGRQLMTLVNDLFQLIRLETGQLKITITLVETEKVCQRAYQAVKEKYQNMEEIEFPFTLEIERGLEKIMADEVQLQQLLSYLLDNAIQLTQQKIGIRVNSWRNWIAFTVWDTGRGISEGEQIKFFNQYQGGEQKLAYGDLQTGLPLILAHRLAKANGGELSFISRKNLGNQFTLLLPFKSNKQGINQEYKHRQKTKNILSMVVESRANNIEDLTDELIELGCRVVVARTGTEGLEKARKLQPEIIFLNPFLPLLSGWDLLQLLKSDSQTKNIKVIITSSESGELESRENGADGFLPMPVESIVLRQILSQWEMDVFCPLKPLTILSLHPNTEQIGSGFGSQFYPNLDSQLSQFNYRLLEADNLEQAEMLASIWEVDVVVLDHVNLLNPISYLQDFSQCESLASLPLITLEPQTTEAANKIKNLSVFPCLIPDSDKKIVQLLQVISIATRT